MDKTQELVEKVLKLKDLKASLEVKKAGLNTKKEMLEKEKTETVQAIVAIAPSLEQFVGDDEKFLQALKELLDKRHGQLEAALKKYDALLG